VDVEISGQVVTEDDINVIKNGNMDMVESDGRATYWTGSWTDESPAHTIVDGISVHTPIVSETDPQFWRYQFTQNNLNALPDEPYIFKFKAWADAERSIVTDFEDTGANGNNRYGSTTDPRSSTGRSEWNLNLTTEPTWYTFDVIFDEIVESTDQKVAFFMGLSNVTTYIDSVYLISEADMGLVPVIVNTLQSFKVYPNPASSKLHIEFSSPNTTVAIYNNVGVKMDEEVVYGTHHMFDVSRYAKGLYFVKANGSVVKFVK